MDVDVLDQLSVERSFISCIHFFFFFFSLGGVENA